MIDLKKNHEQTQRLAQISPIGVSTADAIKAHALQEKIARLAGTKVDYNFAGLDTLLFQYEKVFRDFRLEKLDDITFELNKIDSKMFDITKQIINAKSDGQSVPFNDLLDLIFEDNALEENLHQSQTGVYDASLDQKGYIYFTTTLNKSNTEHLVLTKRDFDLNDETCLLKRTIARLKKEILSTNASFEFTAQEYEHYLATTSFTARLAHPVIHSHNKQFYKEQLDEFGKKLANLEDQLTLFRKVRSYIKALPEETRTMYVNLLELAHQKAELREQYQSINESQWEPLQADNCPYIYSFREFLNTYFMDKEEAIKIVQPFYDYLKANNIDTTLGEDKHGFDLAEYVYLAPYKNATLAILDCDIFEKENNKTASTDNAKLKVIIPANADSDDDDDSENCPL